MPFDGTQIETPAPDPAPPVEEVPRKHFSYCPECDHPQECAARDKCSLAHYGGYP